jgi:hypothetical protein
MCQGLNDVDQPYFKLASIGYQAYPDAQLMLLQNVNITASTSARAGKNESTTKENTDTLVHTAFNMAANSLWPNNPDLKTRAKDGFNQIQPKCLAGTDGASVSSGPTFTLAEGFQIECTRLDTVTVGSDKGPNTTFVETVHITPVAPDTPIGIATPTP